MYRANYSCTVRAQKLCSGRADRIVACTAVLRMTHLKHESMLHISWINRYLDTMQRSEEEYVALKDQIKAAKEAKKKVTLTYTVV